MTGVIRQWFSRRIWFWQQSRFLADGWTINHHVGSFWSWLRPTAVKMVERKIP